MRFRVPERQLGEPMGMLEFEGELYLDARASDPREMGWMGGAPPPDDKRITFERGRYLNFPQMRWSLSHMRELAGTVNVWRGGAARRRSSVAKEPRESTRSLSST